MAGDNFDLQGWMREQKQGPYTGAKGVEKVALKSSKPKSKTGLNEGIMGMIDLQPVGHLSEEFTDDDFAAGMNDEKDLDNYFNSYPEDNEEKYIDEEAPTETKYDIYLNIGGKKEKYGGGPYSKKQLPTVTTSIWSKYGEELDGVGYEKSAGSMKEASRMSIADKWDLMTIEAKEGILDYYDENEEGLADYAYMGWAMVPDEIKQKIGHLVINAPVSAPEEDEDEKTAAMAMKQAKKGAKAVKGLNPEKDIRDLLYGDDEDEFDL